MNNLLRTISSTKMGLVVIVLMLLALMPLVAPAHPMPNSVVLLTVHENRMDAELQIPLSELEAATGLPVNDPSAGALDRFEPQLRAYLLKHTHLQSPDGQHWRVTIGTMSFTETRNTINGTYRELVAQLRLVPPTGTGTRRFTLHYDAVLHQVATHKILVSVSQDWETGQLAEEVPQQVGVIELDIVNNRILPLAVNLQPGNAWTGFVSMVRLGMQHIAEGTDHLLFLLVLLLPAPLLFSRKRWESFGGVRYSLVHLLRIVTAFTVGHSLTLLLGAIGWVHLPGQPVEILIAVSILVSAAHAWRPVFPGNEMWVAAGFGLVHGLAFADTLANLSLGTGRMVLSILGFNAGIELMQLLIIAVTIPVLIALSRRPAYRFVRIGGALVASVAAVFWIIERAAM
jgi:hypothetical protein